MSWWVAFSCETGRFMSGCAPWAKKYPAKLPLFDSLGMESWLLDWAWVLKPVVCCGLPGTAWGSW